MPVSVFPASPERIVSAPQRSAAYVGEVAPRGRSLLNRLTGLATSLLLVNYSLFSIAAGDQTWLPISNAEDLAECEISIKQRFQNRSIPLQVFQRDGRPCVNVNVDSDEWFMIDAVAFDRKRERLGFRQVGVESIRHAVLNGISIKLSPLSREVVIDAKGPKNTASGCKVCVDLGARTVSGVTDEDGIFQFKALMDEPVRQVTVWKNGLIGGFDASRTPIRNPYDDTYSVKMLSTRPFKLRLVHEDRPVSGVTFDLIYRTTPPAYNFVATSRTFMQTRLTTDSNGVAVADWFPDVARHTSYLSFGGDQRFLSAQQTGQGSDEGLTFSVASLPATRSVTGRVIGLAGVEGTVAVRLRSSGPIAPHTIYVFCTPTGTYMADCIIGNDYSISIHDVNLAGSVVHTGISRDSLTLPKLDVRSGVPVEATFKSDGSAELQNKWISFVEEERGTDSDEKSPALRRMSQATDEYGVARFTATPGATISMTASDGDWVSEQKSVVVKNGSHSIEFIKPTRVERAFHGVVRSSVERGTITRPVTVHWVAYGESGVESGKTTPDNQGNFQIRTRFPSVATLVESEVGGFSGYKVIARGNHIDCRLQQAGRAQGVLRTSSGQPLAGAHVGIRLGGSQRNYRVASNFSTLMDSRVNAITDQDGRYELTGIPSGIPIRIVTSKSASASEDESIAHIFLEPGEIRNVPEVYVDQQYASSQLAIAEKLRVRNNISSLYRLPHLVIMQSQETFPFQDALDNQVRDFVITVVSSQDTDAASLPRELKKVRTSLSPGTTWCGILYEDGRVSEKSLIVHNDTTVSDFEEFCAGFRRKRLDAHDKWNSAADKARTEEKNLIVVFGFHRCFPCIRLTSWLDDHKAVLSKDFVLLKFNELCDLHTDNLRRRLFGSEYHGAPAFVIARPDGKVLASSAGPTGNIGYPVGVDELRHLTRMLMLGRKQLTDREIDAIVESLDGE